MNIDKYIRDNPDAEFVLYFSTSVMTCLVMKMLGIDFYWIVSLMIY